MHWDEQIIVGKLTSSGLYRSCAALSDISNPRNNSEFCIGLVWSSSDMVWLSLVVEFGLVEFWFGVLYVCGPATDKKKIGLVWFG